MRRFSLAIGVPILYLTSVVYPTVHMLSLFIELNAVVIACTATVHVILFLPYSFRPVRKWLFRPIGQFVTTWFGLTYALLLVVVPVELLRLAWQLTDLQAGCIALVGWIVLGTWCIWRAQHLSIRQLHVSTDQNSAKRSCVQISDLHIGTRSPGFLARVVRKINRLQPDAVFITGDLVDAPTVSRDDLATLKNLASPTFYCTGNHERYEHCEDIVAWLEAFDVTVLRNEAVTWKEFQFVGIEDTGSGHYVHDALNELSPSEAHCKVLLCHKPQEVTEASDWGFDLMLSGHTHHGQIWPLGLIVRREFNPYRGTHNINGMTLHISPGTGTTGPIFRLGSRSEITRIEFA